MRTKGVSLVELLITAGILVFVLCGLLVLFNNCIFLNKTNRNLTVAMSHAQYVMESVKNTPSDQITTNIDAGVWDWNTDPQFTSNNLIRLTNEAIITNYVPASNPLEVWVDVTWDDPRPMSTGLRTLFN